MSGTARCAEPPIEESFQEWSLVVRRCKHLENLPAQSWNIFVVTIAGHTPRSLDGNVKKIIDIAIARRLLGNLSVANGSKLRRWLALNIQVQQTFLRIVRD